LESTPKALQIKRLLPLVRGEDWTAIT